MNMNVNAVFGGHQNAHSYEDNDDINRAVPVEVPGGSLGSAEPPFLLFCAHASLASCAHTSAVEKRSGQRNSPFQNPRSATECS